MSTPSKILAPPVLPEIQGLDLPQLETVLTEHHADMERYIGDAFRNEFKSEVNWHNFGDVGEPAFQNGWSNYGSPYAPPGFLRVASNMLMLRGWLAGGTPGIATGIFATLPEDFRPEYDTLQTIPVFGGEGQFVYDASAGTLIINSGHTTWSSIDGLMLRI